MNRTTTRNTSIRRIGLWVAAPVLALGLLGFTSPAQSAEKAEGGTHGVQGRRLDAAFIRGVVPHHQASIDMAKVELARGTNPEVRALAANIIAAQESEIATLTEIARSRFGFTPSRRWDRPMGELMGVPISGRMPEMVRMLMKSSRVDHDFLMMMIPHHSSAIVMANEEVMRGRVPELRELAESMKSAQAREIGEMQSLLDSGV